MNKYVIGNQITLGKAARMIKAELLPKEIREEFVKTNDISVIPEEYKISSKDFVITQVHEFNNKYMYSMKSVDQEMSITLDEQQIEELTNQ